MDTKSIYRDIAARTGGDIYIGVVGPVRTGKSTFIKQFMEKLVLPEIDNPSFSERARDELPQSAAGRTIMTTEPKFVPEKAVPIEIEEGVSLRARLIDCVGYMVRGAMGHAEGDRPRMVKSPWFEEEVPFDVAAETGTRKVICEHSTIGLVVTTDGSIGDIPRAEYEQAERRVINELEQLGKPFVVLLNCVMPESAESVALARKLSETYGRAVLPVSCIDMTRETIAGILRTVLFEFPIRELRVGVPGWMTALEETHWLKQSLYGAVRAFAESVSRMKDIARDASIGWEYAESGSAERLDLGTGTVYLRTEPGKELFYRVLGEAAGLEISGEADLMPCVVELAAIRAKYEKLRSALEQVEATGYGVVMPSIDELHLEEPELMQQSGRYGVRLRASAPALNIIRTEIHTEVSPIVGTERQSEDLVKSLLEGFEEDPTEIWQSNIFGKSLHELVNEGLQAKLLNIPPAARARLGETLERVINEGCSGLICIIL